MKHSIQLLVLAGLSLLGSTMKHILSTQEESRPTYQITKITLENQMDVFMDKDSIIGEWIAYFENTRLCNMEFCKKGLSEMEALPQLIKNKIKVAHIDW